MRRDGSDEKIDFVHACLLGVESGDNAELTSAILYQGAVSDAERDKLDHANAAWCEGLIKYVADHELHTNHPRQPSTGALVS